MGREGQEVSNCKHSQLAAQGWRRGEGGRKGGGEVIGALAGTHNQTFLLTGDGDGDGLRDDTFTISATGASPALCMQVAISPQSLHLVASGQGRGAHSSF